MHNKPIVFFILISSIAVLLKLILLWTGYLSWGSAGVISLFSFGTLFAIYLMTEIAYGSLANNYIFKIFFVEAFLKIVIAVNDWIKYDDINPDVYDYILSIIHLIIIIPLITESINYLRGK